MSAISSAVAIRVLLGHAVGEHRGAADAVGVDHGDVGAELRGDQRCLVPAGTATDHHHTIHAAPSSQSRNARRYQGPCVGRLPPCLCTPPSGRTWTRAGWASAARTPRCAAPAGWSGWRLTFGGEEHGWDGALATIVEDPLEQVFVAIYDVTAEDEQHLDVLESADTGLYRKTKVRVSTLTGEQLAWAYVLDAYEGGLPSASYLGILAEAAEAADAPEDYVAALRARPCRSVGL